MSGDDHVRIDEVDREIVELLNQNSSLPPADVAEQLGVERSEVESRIGRLEEENAYDRFTVIDPRKVGWTVPGYAFAQCEETYNEAIDESLKFVDRHDGVQSIGTLYGEYDIIIRKLSTDLYKLNNFATNSISYSTAQKTYPTTELVRWHGIDVDPADWETDTDVEETIDSATQAVLRELQEDPQLKRDHMSLAHRLDVDLDEVSAAIKELEKRDIILGYSVEPNLERLGWGRVYMGISTLSDLPPTNDNQVSNYHQVRDALRTERKADGIRKDHLHVPIVGSGIGSTTADVFVELLYESMDHLDRLTDEIREMDGVKTTRTYLEANQYHSNYAVGLE